MYQKPVFAHPRSYGKLANLLLALFHVADTFCVDEEEAGGYFCLADEDGEIILIQRVEAHPLSTADAKKTLAYCQEKIQRLHMHPEHLTSMESRDPEKKMWGGAIRINGGYMSFSGFSEKADQQLCIRLAVISRSLSLEEALKTNASGDEDNSFLPGILQEDLRLWG